MDEIVMEFEHGDVVHLRKQAAGMPSGSEGVVIGRWLNSGEVLVRFWDGGPLRVDPLLLVETTPSCGDEGH